MSNNTKTTTQIGGVGFLGMLALLFIALKLTGTITWSWWLVLAPLWIPTGLVVSVIVVALIAFGIAFLIDLAQSARARKRLIARKAARK